MGKRFTKVKDDNFENFKRAYKLTDREMELFKAIYKREMAFKTAIWILAMGLAVSLLANLL